MAELQLVPGTRCPHGAVDVGACLPCFAAIDAIARAQWERHFPSARKGDWDWLPAQARRQWLEQAKEDWLTGSAAAALILERARG